MVHHQYKQFTHGSPGDYVCATDDCLARFNYKKSQRVESQSYRDSQAVKAIACTRNLHSTIPVSVAKHVHSRGNAFITPNSPDVNRLSKTPVLGIF